MRSLQFSFSSSEVLTDELMLFIFRKSWILVLLVMFLLARVARCVARIFSLC